MNPLYLTILFAVLLCLLRGAVVAIDEVGSSLQAEQSNPEASSVQSNAEEIDIEVNEEDEIEVSEHESEIEDNESDPTEVTGSERKTVPNLGDGEGLDEGLDGLIGQIKDRIKKDYKAPDNMKDSILEFAAAINWKEPFIMYLLVALVSLLIFTLLTLKISEIQMGIFFMICICVFLSERLNKVCAENWSHFATQNYFDAKGTFAGIFFAGPLLLIGFIQLLNFLYTASQLLVKVKRQELAMKNKEKGKDKTQ